MSIVFRDIRYPTRPLDVKLAVKRIDDSMYMVFDSKTGAFMVLETNPDANAKNPRKHLVEVDVHTDGEVYRYGVVVYGYLAVTSTLNMNIISSFADFGSDFLALDLAIDRIHDAIKIFHVSVEPDAVMQADTYGLFFRPFEILKNGRMMEIGFTYPNDKYWLSNPHTADFMRDLIRKDWVTQETAEAVFKMLGEQLEKLEAGEPIV